MDLRILVNKSLYQNTVTKWYVEVYWIFQFMIEQRNITRSNQTVYMNNGIQRGVSCFLISKIL